MDKKPAKSNSKGLGRGLDALLGDVASSQDIRSSQPHNNKEEHGNQMLAIEFITANPKQPRQVFDDVYIDELANSIKSRGVLQPILVRPKKTSDGRQLYEIVAGERRWRAAQKAQCHEVPVIIRDLNDQEAAEIALIENVQRVNLNPMEEAEAYQHLSDHYKRSQEEISKVVGKSRSHIANMMRLTALPEQVRQSLSSGEITAGHGRALLASKTIIPHFAIVTARKLNVRQTEKLVKGDGFSPGTILKAPKSVNKRKDADTRALERDLAIGLGLEVDIDHKSNGGGSVTVKYRDLDQLDDVCRRLLGSAI